MVDKMREEYRKAGNFRMVEIFGIFRREHHTKMKISLHNTVNMFYVTMLSCTNMNIKVHFCSLYENLHQRKLPAIRYFLKLEVCTPGRGH